LGDRYGTRLEGGLGDPDSVHGDQMKGVRSFRAKTKSGSERTRDGITCEEKKNRERAQKREVPNNCVFDRISGRKRVRQSVGGELSKLVKNSPGSQIGSSNFACFTPGSNQAGDERKHDRRPIKRLALKKRLGADGGKKKKLGKEIENPPALYVWAGRGEVAPLKCFSRPEEGPKC